MNRPVRVYRLDVTYPDHGPLRPDGEHSGHSWPAARRYLTRSGAEARAALLRSLGADVTVVPSEPVVWPAP